MRSFIFAALAIGALSACEPTQSTVRTAPAGAASACDALGELASTIMGVRQQGVSQDALDRIIAPRLAQDPSLAGLVNGIVKTAYSVDVAPSAAGRETITRDFAKVTENACLTAVAT